MDDFELLQEAIQFIELQYKDDLTHKARKKKDHLVISYHELCRYCPDLAMDLYNHPIKVLDMIKSACKDVMPSLPDEFTIRIKDATEHLNIISALKKENVGRMVVVTGLVKQKYSSAERIATKIIWKCNCGLDIPYIQKDELEKEQKPSICPACKNKAFHRGQETQIDRYFFTLEQPPGVDTHSNLSAKPPTLNVMAKMDLCNPEVFMRFGLGSKLEVTGILKQIPVQDKGAVSIRKLEYLDANYIRVIGDTFDSFKWAEEDVPKFEELAAQPHWLQKMKSTVFHGVQGLDEECEAALLLLFGSVTKRSHDEYHKVTNRGFWHILMVGDPGVSKSRILKHIEAFAPKSMFVDAGRATTAGLIGSIQKDELTGTSVADAGAIPLMNKGILMLDELNEMEDTNKDHLKSAMENGVVTIVMHNVKCSFECETSIIAAANPEFDYFSDNEPVTKQFKIGQALLSRFDLVYAMRLNYTSDQMLSIIKKMKSAHHEAPIDAAFLKRYIAYAKHINPIINESVQAHLEEAYMKIYAARHNNKTIFDVGNPRIMASITRLTESIARSRLHKEATLEDADLAIKKIVNMLMRLGVELTIANPTRIDVVVEMHNGQEQTTISTPVEPYVPTAFRREDENVLSYVRNIFREKKNNDPHDPGYTEEQLLAICKTFNINEEELTKVVDLLNRKGDLIEPRRSYWIYKG